MTWLHPTAERVLAHLRGLDEPVMAWEVARDLAIPGPSASAALRELRACGLVSRSARGWCGRRVMEWSFG